MTDKKQYDLIMKTRKYRDQTLCSVYYKPTEKSEKKFEPVDIDGYRMRLNKETGEVDFYSREIASSGRDSSVRRSKIKMHMILDMNDFDWFVTLTFNNNRVQRDNPEEVYKAYSKFIDLLKKECPTLRYITVPEQHEDEKHCYHFHLLVGGISVHQLGLVNSGKVCCHWARKGGICSKEYFEVTKDRYVLQETDGIPVYNISKFQYGFSTVSRIQSRERCNFYVQKYIDKNFGTTDDFKKRFFYSANLKMPEEKDIILAERQGFSNLLEKNVVMNNLCYQYSEQQRYNERFNNLQFWVSNEYMSGLEKNLIPLDLIPGQVDLEDLLDFNLI